MRLTSYIRMWRCLRSRRILRHGRAPSRMVRTDAQCTVFRVLKDIAEWTKAPLSQRKIHVELLLEGLEHRDATVRFTNSRRLFYIVQGWAVVSCRHSSLLNSRLQEPSRKPCHLNINYTGYLRIAKLYALLTVSARSWRL